MVSTPLTNDFKIDLPRAIWNSKCYVIREHFLSITVHPISTHVNNNPTLTPMDLLEHKYILPWKNETVGIQNNIRPKINASENEQYYDPASCT